MLLLIAAGLSVWLGVGRGSFEDSGIHLLISLITYSFVPMQPRLCYMCQCWLSLEAEKDTWGDLNSCGHRFKHFSRDANHALARGDCFSNAKYVCNA